MKSISTTFPWDLGSPSEIVRQAGALGCEDICIRATDGPNQYGVNNWTRARWGGQTHHDLERQARAEGLTVSIWCAVYLNAWNEEAEAIKEAVAFYNPTAVFLDAEKKDHLENIGPFLRSLGRLPTKVYLQSFRRADLHPEMAWEKWFGYKDAQTGAYIIDGQGQQLYPIGWVTPQEWVEQFSNDVGSHEREAAAVGRPDLPWFPTMPTFVSGSFEGVSGWRPRPDAFLAAVEWLKSTLGERLIGLNFWSLDRHLATMSDLSAVIPDIELPSAAVPVEPGDQVETAPLPLWANEVDAWARGRGYDGPRPPAP